MDKSIDLGKLQNDLAKARALLIAATRDINAANARYHSAVRVLEQSKKKYKAAEMAVDTAKTAMLEASRTVANG